MILLRISKDFFKDFLVLLRRVFLWQISMNALRMITNVTRKPSVSTLLDLTTVLVNWDLKATGSSANVSDLYL